RLFPGRGLVQFEVLLRGSLFEEPLRRLWLQRFRRGLIITPPVCGLRQSPFQRTRLSTRVSLRVPVLLPFRLSVGRLSSTPSRETAQSSRSLGVLVRERLLRFRSTLRALRLCELGRSVPL